MDKKNESSNGKLFFMKRSVAINCLIWLVMFMTLLWSACSCYVMFESSSFLEDWPVFEKTVFLVMYALVSCFMTEFIYCNLLKWANQQVFSFTLLYLDVFVIFIIVGFICFAIFFEQAIIFWFGDFLSWRCLPCVVGVLSFIRFAKILFKDL